MNKILVSLPPTGAIPTPVSQHTEYPKWLHFAGKPSVLVDDAEAEAKMVAAHAETAPKAPEINVSTAVNVAAVNSSQGVNILSSAVNHGVATENEKEALLAQAAISGVKVDKRWGIDRIKAALAT